MSFCASKYCNKEARPGWASARKNNERQYYLKRAEETSKMATAWRRAIEKLQTK